MPQPLLAEELMDLTIEELIEDHGAVFSAQEHWWGFSFQLNIGGTVIYDAPHADELNYDELDDLTL